MKRRTFLSIAAQAVAARAVFPSFAIGKPGPSANGKLNIAFIGSGGWIARQPYEQGCQEENLVAFCDVDRDQCAENMKNWRTTQPFFEDFRVMLDKMHKEIDAVVVSTPDHTHFPATLAAMERGIHVYTQKPLTHNVWQARTLVKAKERYKVVTQMGNQGMRASDSEVGRSLPGRRDRRGERGLCPQLRPRNGRTAFCQSGDDAAPVVARARGTRLGSLARPRGQTRLLSRLSPLQVAGVLRLRLGHTGRLGMPHL
jgi:hypothetical protein